ncbi:MAG: hypothetical protein AVO35_08370 [Candidatus Aegiribacteria sp. MLS_C]|nr:MAG: hypothetical protein AVO35_08370 [Candidatus Aegiribacteria sp. MLS_C]
MLDALWRLVGRLVSLAGRLLSGTIGLVLLVLGAVLCLTVIGAAIGIPLVILGVLLLVRSLF